MSSSSVKKILPAALGVALLLYLLSASARATPSPSSVPEPRPVRTEPYVPGPARRFPIRTLPWTGIDAFAPQEEGLRFNYSIGSGRFTRM